MLPTEDSPCLRVIEAVAEEEGIPAKDLEPPLADKIAPGHLDGLLTDTGGSEVVVEFVWCGYNITITSDYEVTTREKSS